METQPEYRVRKDNTYTFAAISHSIDHQRVCDRCYNISKTAKLHTNMEHFAVPDCGIFWGSASAFVWNQDGEIIEIIVYQGDEEAPWGSTDVGTALANAINAFEAYERVNTQLSMYRY